MLAADRRAAEIDSAIREARVDYREKGIAREEAEGVCKVGEQYNVPDVGDLRAGLKAKTEAAAAAKARWDKLGGGAGGPARLGGGFAGRDAPSPANSKGRCGGRILTPPAPPASGDYAVLATTAGNIAGAGRKQGWLEV